MIKNYSLVLIAFLCFVVSGFGQVAAWDFTGEASPATSTADVYSANLDSSNLITRGTTAASSAGANSFRTTGFQNNGISTTNTDYFQVTLSATVGNTLSLSTIDANLTGTTSFAVSPGVSSQFAYSLDGTNFTLIGSPQVTIGVNQAIAQINLTGIPALQNIPAATTVTIRYYASGQTTTGGWGLFSSAAGVYGLSIGGTVSPTSPTPTITVTPATLTGFNYIQGAGPSAEQTFTASGTNLLTPIVLTAPTNYQISTTTGAGFGTTVNLTPTLGTVSATTIYTRLAAGLTENTYSGNITATSTSATTRNVAVSGTVTNLIDYCNIQFPTTTQTIVQGATTNVVYAQVYEPGVTDTPFSQGAGITAWIGYSATNSNPNTGSWTWFPAAYNNIGGSNDEYFREIGSALLPGTYYYASRFQLNSGAYAYGGSGGVWNNDSVQLIVTPDQVDFCNVDFPKLGNILTGGSHTVYAQAYEPGVTNAAGQGAGILAWIGYNSANVSPISGTGWTWVAATYDSDFGNNDQYRATFGAALPAGTYYYASRFQLNGSSYSYGGIQSDNVGNFWDPTTNNNGILTITNPPCNDLMISEYVEGSSNNKYIEIYNPTASAINLTGYSLVLYANGTTTATNTENLTGSIPAYGTVVYRNSAATIYSGTTIVSPVCNFNGDDAIALFNGANYIDIIGTVGHDPGAAWVSGAYSTENQTLRRKSTVQNGITVNPATGFPTLVSEWDLINIDDVSDLGNHISDCQGPTPELQLADNTATNQNCGYTINFGTRALSTNTDITFTVKNVGSADLTVTSFGITGDYTIVSPATPFTVTAGNNQVVTVRFTPTVNGTRTGIVTINNNDSNEGACTVNLTGVGFTPAPEIDIERNTGATIPTGSAASLGYNTIFGTTVIGNSTAPKTYFIHNEGTADLTVTSLTSSNATEFPIVTSLTFPLTITPGSSVLFEIQFSPISAAPPTRTSVITIRSNDTDEDPYTFTVQGTADCAATALTISPNSGPVGTIITVQGTNFGGSTTATINGNSANVIVLSTTVIEVTVPINATTGSLEVVNQLGCKSSILFTVINNLITSCEGTGTVPSNLFISEVTDHGSGSHSYVEIFNGTGGAVNLTGYELRIHNNGAATATNTIVLSGTVANNDVFVVAFGSTDATNPYATHGYDQFSNVSGINEDDNIRLYSGTTWVDLWGETTGNTFTIASKNYTYRRKNTGITVPNTTWNPSDWNSFTPVDYSDIGAFDFSTGVPPTVTLQPIAPISNCDLTATLTIAGEEGYDAAGDTQELAYQWYYSAPTDTGWTAVTNGALYSGATSTSLNILNTLNLDKYQYYCQVRENGATCYKATNAVRLTVLKAVWTGTWSSPPTINKIAVIDADYTTDTTNGSFSACQLLVNATRTLTISDNYFVEVENNVINNGIIEVHTKGSFVQNQNGAAAGVFTNNGIAKVLKQTANFNDDGYNLHYTYWSSPVNDPSNPSGNPDVPAYAQDIATVFPNPAGNRRFYFNATNFIDSFAETGNQNQANPGQDDIDDDYNDWQVASGAMEVGRGYAVTATSPPAVPTPFPYSNIAEFSGAFNTGDITVKMYKNNNEVADNNWNFIGNPYPSAISVNKFFDANVTNFPVTQPANPAEGAIFLWSQAQPPLNTNNGNEGYNFSQSDYAVINRVTQTAGASGITPLRYIPSGQGFFIAYKENLAPGSNSNTITKGDIIFTNSMREKSNNTQFFRNQPASEDSSNQGRNADDTNILWLNLSSDNGVFNQIAVAYVAEATDGYDGWSYDTPRNLSSGAHAELYSIIHNEASRFSIQAKNSNSLDIEEIISLGFSTSINVATLYKLSLAQIEGSFLTQNTIYLKDNLLNTYHNLSQSDYNFTSESGEFNDRFEIVFRAETLSVGDNEIAPNGLSIVELNDGRVKFSVNSNLTIQSVEIIDMLGRTLYQLKGTNATETYNLSNLSQAAYIAKVKLSNGQTIAKRAIKRQ